VFARSTTIQARPESIDDGIRFVADEVMPMIMGMDGCVGLSMIVDRTSGRCIATSAWRDQDTMRATDGLLTPMRNRAASLMGGDLMVEEWEIAVLHREHQSSEGACVRATWLQVDPSEVEHAIDIYRMHSLTEMDELEGFCSASLFVDRRSGRACTSATYDNMESMERSRERAKRIRETATREIGATVTDVSEFELALAHLHVPEMV
jgi:hypothetical protein